MKRTPEIKNKLRAIPSVQELLQHGDLAALPIDAFLLKQIVQEEIARIREVISASNGPAADAIPVTLHNRIRSRVEQLLQPSLRRVVNCSGILLHTNMGRAPLADAARKAALEVSDHYANLELNLQSGRRGDRQSHCEDLLCLLTGSEAALVVNNCAAAILLVLTAICRRKEVPVSRGELVEIGGSFRMPDVMKFSGARMVEVGTTNKTHPADYAGAINERTSAVLKVHCSNYRVVGFTSEVTISELGEIAQAHDIPLIYDMGSGMLEDMQHPGYPHEPTAREILQQGADVVTFSGDKILGGPQSGIIAGKKRYLDKIRKHHLARALRCDKMSIAALEATLRLYLQPGKLTGTLPVATLLATSVETLRERAEEICRKVAEVPGAIEVVDAPSRIGSGAFPLETVPSIALQVRSQKQSPLKLARRLRENTPPVIGYVQDDVLMLNLRTVRSDEDEILVAAIKKLLKRP